MGEGLHADVADERPLFCVHHEPTSVNSDSTESYRRNDRLELAKLSDQELHRCRFDTGDLVNSAYPMEKEDIERTRAFALR